MRTTTAPLNTKILYDFQQQRFFSLPQPQYDTKIHLQKTHNYSNTLLNWHVVY